MDRNFMAMSRKMFAMHRFLCLGLDTDYAKLPPHLKDGDKGYDIGAVVDFNVGIVEAVEPLIGFVKLNTAFYEAYGSQGLMALKLTIRHIKLYHPDLVIILDAKRADIDNTNLGYVAFQEMMGADAITVHPYLGAQAMGPFLAPADKGVIVLCRTSNKGAGELQDLSVNIGDMDMERQAKLVGQENIGIIDHVPLYQIMALNAAELWNKSGNCAVVAGATYPDELGIIRRLVGDMPILIPGIGAQGGDVLKTVQAAGGDNMIINNSRGIIFASSGGDYVEAAYKAALQTRDLILGAVHQVKGG